MADKEWRGRIGGMTPERMELFLTKGKSLARVACRKPDGSPYVMPVWYHWEDEAFWFAIRKRAAWAKWVVNDPRVAIVVDENSVWTDASLSDRPFEIPKVYAEGRMEVAQEPVVGGLGLDLTYKCAERYFGANGPEYVESTKNQPRWAFKCKPDRIRTWEGVGWARRYWVEEAGGPTWEQAHGQPAQT